jgi:succinoglycan biosynthesis transport protein ExoP
MNELSRQSFDDESPVSHDSHKYLDIRRIWFVLLRRWRVLIGCTVCVTVAALVWMTLATPVYTATAKLLIDSRKTKAMNSEAIVSDLELDLNTVATEVSLVKSFPVAKRVTERLKLNDNPDFAEGAGLGLGSILKSLASFLGFGDDGMADKAPVAGLSPEMLETIRLVEKGIDVKRLTTTYFIEVSFSHRNSALAAAIANAVAEAYLDEQLEVRYQAANRAATWLSDRVLALRAQLETSERALSEYRSHYNLARPESGSLAEQQAGEINTQLVAARAQTVEKKAKYDQAQRILDGGAGIDSVAAVMDTPAIAELRTQETAIARQKAELMMRYGPEHPAIVKIRAEQGDIDRQLKREVARVVQTLKTDYEFAQKKEESLADSLTGLTASHKSEEQAVIRLRELERDVQSNRTLYDAVLNRFKEAEQQTSLQSPESRLVAPAFAPEIPSFPKKRLMLPASMVLGLMMGVALICLLEYLENGFTGAVQVEQALGLPVVAIVPQLGTADRTLDGRIVPIQKYAALRPQSAFGESIRSVRMITQMAGPPSRSKLVLVTSSISAEGKTTMALSLAASAAAASRHRILLADCDLRAQSVSRQFNVPDKQGLTDVLTGRIDLADALYPTSHPSLTLLPAGATTDDPADLLSSQRMFSLLRELKDNFDIVYLDAPPILPVIDAVVLSDFVDKIVFVVRWRSTPRNLAVRAMQMLGGSARKISGVALNGARLDQLPSYDPHSTYYHKSYQAYYAG